jgi:hypothetical protein
MMEVPVPKKKEKTIEEEEIKEKKEKPTKKKLSLGEKIFNYIYGDTSEDLASGPIQYLWRIYKF